MQQINLVWFRNDLRCLDNVALYSALEDGKRRNVPVLALFVATPDSWRLHDMAAIKQDLIRRRVLQLQQELAALNIPLLATEGTDYQSIATLFSAMATNRELRVFAQAEYELREQQRDNAVEQILNANAGQFIRFDSICVMPPGSVCNQQGKTYKVFTPFKQQWLSRLHAEGIHCVRQPDAQTLTLAELPVLPAMETGDNSSEGWEVSEQAILARMRQFCREQVSHYQQLRDYPAIDGTSGLSAYLAIGVLSARQCIARLQLESGESWRLHNTGAEVWLSELIWRDFYKHILVSWPMLIKHQPFQADTDAIRWRNDPILFQAWCDGKTGYPIVDAAMRQLNQTGLMHNRLRMITASFLVKDLHIDWRWGERYFMSRLIDGDFAANNGGWQWAASTGTDAVPYFRIFNPVSQSEKFDPDGVFIRQYVPELAEFSGPEIHWPHKRGRVAGYVEPIVDHALARQQTLALFAEIRQKG